MNLNNHSLDEMTIAKLHNEAMQICDLAMAANDPLVARGLYRDALVYESAAASRLASRFDHEPTRSVLYRGAASMALRAKEIRTAERLIAMALCGNPPDEMAEELRDLLEQVHFERHMDLRGLELSPNEFQLSIAGPAVGFGIAQSDEFVGRVQIAQKILIRNIERQTGRKFRETGRTFKEVEKNFDLYVSVPRAASFAVTLRVGLPDKQMYLAGFEGGSAIEPKAVVDNVLQCLLAFEASDDGVSLRGLIPDPAYYRNFVALASQLAPDGDRVKMVGFTASRGENQERVALERPKWSLAVDREVKGGEEKLNVKGRLRFANSTSRSNIIKVVDDEDVRYAFKVPEGMMTDIVKPYWHDRVSVWGTRVGKQVILERIEKDDNLAKDEKL